MIDYIVEGLLGILYLIFTLIVYIALFVFIVVISIVISPICIILLLVDRKKDKL